MKEDVSSDSSVPGDPVPHRDPDVQPGDWVLIKATKRRKWSRSKVGRAVAGPAQHTHRKNILDSSDSL